MNCAISHRSTRSLFLYASGKWAAPHYVCPFSLWPPWQWVTVPIQVKTLYFEQTWLSMLMVTSTRKLTFAVGIRRETLGYIACDTLAEKVWIVTCCNDKITADSDLVVALYLQYCSWNDVLADGACVHIVTEDGMTTNNYTCNLFLL